MHFAATSSDQDQDSSEFVTSSAILSHLSFVELADLESDPATVELSADRDIGGDDVHEATPAKAAPASTTPPPATKGEVGAI